MKRLTFIGIILVLVFTGCKVDKDICRYDVDRMYRPNTDFFVSFEIDGKKVQYYQGGYPGGMGYSPIEYKNGQYLHCSSREVSFNRADSTEYFLLPTFRFSFWRKSIAVRNGPYIGIDTPLSETIESTHTFVDPPNDFTLRDSLFLEGVSVDYGTYSTENVCLYYNYDFESVNQFLDGSYFKITSIEPVCTDLYLVKGTFTTKIMIRNAPSKIRNIVNGQFAFLTR